MILLREVSAAAGATICFYLQSWISQNWKTSYECKIKLREGKAREKLSDHWKKLQTSPFSQSSLHGQCIMYNSRWIKVGRAEANTKEQSEYPRKAGTCPKEEGGEARKGAQGEVFLVEKKKDQKKQKCELSSIASPQQWAQKQCLQLTDVSAERVEALL